MKLKINLCQKVGSLLAMMCLTSCATIFTGTKAHMVLEGELDDTLTIQTPQQTLSQVTLPQQVDLRKKQLRKPIVVSKAGEEVARIVPHRKVSPFFWSNLITVSTILGLPVDALTGSMYKPADTEVETPLGQMRLRVLQPQPQFYRHEISASVGLGFQMNVRDGVYDDLSAQIYKKTSYIDGRLCNYWGPATLGLRYYYHLNPSWAIGLQYGWLADYRPFIRLSKDESGGDLRLHSHFLMPSVKWNWYKGNSWGLYSRGSFGIQYRRIFFDVSHKYADYQKLEKKKWLPAFHVSLVGAEFGKKHFRFFTELGFGMDGIGNSGLSYCF